jgi:hypothetical protein
MTDSDLRALERSLFENDTPETRLRLARELERHGRLDAAVTVLEPAARSKYPPPGAPPAFLSMRETLWKRHPPHFDWPWRAEDSRGAVQAAEGTLVWRERRLGNGLNDDGTPVEIYYEKQTFSAFSDSGPPRGCRAPWRILRDLVVVFVATNADWFLRDRAKLEEFGEEAERTANKYIDCEECSGTGEIDPPGSMFHPFPKPERCYSCVHNGYSLASEKEEVKPRRRARPRGQRARKRKRSS